MSKRIVCFMAAIALIVASAVPAYAVTPQEGWFISGTMERDGINYYIIDNKVNDQKWWVDLNAGSLTLSDMYESGFSDINGNLTSIFNGIEGFYFIREAYRGFSPDKSFRIDNDWLLEVTCASNSVTMVNMFGSSTSTSNNTHFVLAAIDKSKLPLISTNYTTLDAPYLESFGFSLEQPLMNVIPKGGSTVLNGPQIGGDQIGQTLYYPMSNFFTTGLFTNADSDYSILGEEGISSSDLDGCDINDLVIFPIGNYAQALKSCSVQARLFFRFLCPVDKAPSGMAVGDRWPKVWPLEVEMQEAYQEYYDRMLANGQIMDPDDIDMSFGQLNQWKDTLELGLNNVPADGLTFAGLTMGVLGSSLGSWLAWIFIGCLLLVFINKAVH